jgi:hypothetical protein
VAVSSFSERHAPSPRPLGPNIPVGVRAAIDSWFAERHVESQEIRRQWFQRQGYGDVADVEDDVRGRWGTDAASALHSALEADPLVSQSYSGDVRRNAATLIVYRHVPAPFYLDYVELAIERYVRDRAIVEVEYVAYVDDPMLAPVEYLNGLFAARSIDYRFDEQGRAAWHGDAGAHTAVIRPALDALGDPELEGCRREFEAALAHLRRGTPKDREDAIEEAWKSVESAMKILLDKHRLAPPDKQTTEPLWIALRDSGIVETPTRDAIVATSRIRNEWGHGQGGEVRVIPDGIPELAVQSAAGAIVYLASRLP